MTPAPLRNIFDRLTVAWHERAIVLKAISFALVGVVNTAIDFGVFWTTATYLHWPLIPANVLAWLVAVTCSYAMNSFITFGPESGRILRWRDYASFVTSGVAGMVSSTAILFALSFFVPILLAKLLSIVVSFAVNFALSHFVVFRLRQPRDDAG
ncbi:MAG: GtrA family protein [Pseudolabrys sp.]